MAGKRDVYAGRDQETLDDTTDTVIADGPTKHEQLRGWRPQTPQDVQKSGTSR